VTCFPNNYFHTFDREKVRQTVEENGTITKVDYCGPGACPELENIERDFCKFLDFLNRDL